MAGLENLNNIEITNVANYVYERWSTSKKKFTPKEIEIALANCE
jgi:mono/diheme cytochrome c family protein